jgi:hypothetical protein
MEVIEDDGREFAGSDEDDEDYNEDDIEHSDDERPASPLPRAKRARASAAATPAVDPAEQCLEDLKKMRAKHAKKGAVLPDDTLWMIATMRPLSE